MQTSMLYMLQAAASPKVERTPPERSEDREKSDFRDLMKKAQVENRDVEQPEERQKIEEDPEEAVLQELSAMQMFMEVGRLPVMQQVQQNQVMQNAVPEQTMNANAASGVQVPVDDAGSQPLMQMNQTAVKSDAQAQAMGQPQSTEQMETVTPQARMEGHQAGQKETGTSKQEMTATEKTGNGSTAEQTDGAEYSVFGNVETAPVKVSEIAKPQAADQPKSVGAQVEEPVTKAIQQGETRVELQLEPAHLGKVTVELTQREDGTIHVALYAENGQTRGLLEKDMSGLQQLLNRNAQQEVQVEVPRYQENQQQDLRDGHQQENQHRQQQQQRHHDSGEDFLSRLRLGLIPMEEEAS